MKLLKLLVVVLTVTAFCPSSLVMAQDPAFTEVSANLPSEGGTVAWGDYDGDGDLDVVIAGPTGYATTWYSKIYRNDSGVFTDINAGLPGVRYPIAAWGDYDNDGDLDLVIGGNTLSGSSIYQFLKVYQNDNGTFRDAGSYQSATSNMPIDTVSWVDYDNDGDLDLFASEANNIRLLRNDKGVLTDTNPAIRRLSPSSCAWGDYDNDGDMDLLFAGYNLSTNINSAMLYRNDGGIFNGNQLDITDVQDVSVSWRDYDNDGDLDIAIGGSYSLGSTLHPSLRIYRNEGGSFEDTGIEYGTTTSFYIRGLAWGDYDNDGDLDLAVSSGQGGMIYYYDSGRLHDSGIRLAYYGDDDPVCGDYDGDGDLDILYGEHLFRNNSPTRNFTPAPPTALTTTLVSNAVAFGWNAGSDIETPTAGLTYNLRVGTAPGKEDVLSAMANLSSGKRLLPAMGSAQGGLVWNLKLAPGTYYWSVQSIDTAFTGSQWAPEQTVTVSWLTIRGHIVDQAGTGLSRVQLSAGNGIISWTDDSGIYEMLVPPGWNGTVTPAREGLAFTPASRTYSSINGDQTDQDYTSVGGFSDVQAPLLGTRGSVYWMDYDTDGDLDLLVTDWGTSGLYPRIYRNVNGSLSDDSAVIFSMHGSPAWGDYDNDGNPDLVLSGTKPFIGSYTALHRNNNGVFTIDDTLQVRGKGGVAWGDYDNDGDIDLAWVGYYVDGTAKYALMINRNDRGSFTRVILDTSTMTGVISWGDYDNDGDLDLVFAGDVYDYTNKVWQYGIVKVYRNDGGTMTETSVGALAGRQSITWVDYDSDGDLDLMIDTSLFRNEGGTFTKVDVFGAGFAAVVWGDYDNDGDSDAAVMHNYPDEFRQYVEIYRNDNGAFTCAVPKIVQVKTDTYQAPLAWGDYDNDGDLDLGFAGYNSSGYLAKVLRNEGGVFNTSPEMPGGLSVAEGIGNITFRWEAAMDAQTPAGGLTYNMRVGTAPGKSDVFSGMASLTGYRFVPDLGNVQKGKCWTLKGLPNRTYYWSVQAIDSAFAGSAWAPEQVINYQKRGIAGAKALADGSFVALKSQVVTGVFGDAFYIESDDRSCGIRVEKVSHGLTTNQRADVAGTMTTTSGGERCITASAVAQNGTGGITPLLINGTSLGGGDLGLQSAVWSWRWIREEPGQQMRYLWLPAEGLNNIGLLVRICGKVTYVGTGLFYLDDGSMLDDNSGHRGIKVYGTVPTAQGEDPVGKILSVTGISCCEKPDDEPVRVIRTRVSSDIRLLQ